MSGPAGEPSARPWGDAPVREPMVNAPWPVLLLIAALILAHIARLADHIDPAPFALSDKGLAAGRFGELLSYQFVHGNWPHVLMNSAFTLAFGPPVARFLSGRARGASIPGAILFLVFFLLCGVISALGYAGWMTVMGALGHPSQPWSVIGASGAVYGLLAAAARLIEGRGQLGSIAGRTVIGMTAVWIALNVFLGLSGLTPGTQGAPVAWEAHICGYAAGLVMISPFAWLARITQSRLDSTGN